MRHMIVGDIAGQLGALKIIHAEAERRYGAVKVIGAGDPNDRGPDSKGVIDFLMNGHECVDSNHGQMMLAFLQPDIGTAYEDASFIMNGGMTTAESYLPGFMVKYSEAHQQISDYWMGWGNRPPKTYYWGMRNDLFDVIPKEHLDWLANRPMFIDIATEDNTIRVTHAPINPTIAFDKLVTDAQWKHAEQGLLWNRGKPRRIDGILQVYGHNAYKSVKEHEDDLGLYALGIDTSGARVLTGYIIETGEYIRATYDGQLLE